MTNQNEDDPNQDAGADVTAAVETPGEDPGEDPGDNKPPGEVDHTQARGGSRGRWVAWLSLLVALLAAAGTGYLWIGQRAQQQLSAQIADRQADLGARAATLGGLQGDFESMSRASAQLNDEVAGLTAQVNRQQEEYSARMTRLEQTVDKIPGIAENVRAAWLRAEAEYYLRIANAQLNLAGNIDVAKTALDMADEKLQAIGDPGLRPVRAQLSDERIALNALPRPDIEGIVLTLGSLARSLETLPLARRAPGQYGNRRSGEMSESGLERAWRAIVDALVNIISVKRDSEPVTPLMSEADESMLIRSLDIELQIARLAAMRSEPLLYRRSLEAVTDRLELYFDTDATSVDAALNTVNELKDTQLPDALPDISGSLVLLLQTGGGAVGK